MEWIKCSERLPEVSKNATDFQIASGESDIVFIMLNGHPTTATYHANIDRWAIPFHSGDWRPSHWMPYEPPKL